MQSPSEEENESEDEEIIDFSQSPLKLDTKYQQETIPHIEENLNTQDFANIDLMVTETPVVPTDRSKNSKQLKQDKDLKEQKEKSKFSKPSENNLMNIQISGGNSPANNSLKESGELVKTIFTKVTSYIKILFVRFQKTYLVN